MNYPTITPLPPRKPSREHDNVWTRLHYRWFDENDWDNHYPSALDFITVVSADVQGDEEAALKGIASSNNNPRSIDCGVPDWQAVPDGFTFTVVCDWSLIGYTITWTCEVEQCIELSDWPVNLAAVQEFSRLVYGRDGLMVGGYGGERLRLCKEMVNALTAYLQANAQKFRYPLEAEHSAYRFFEYMANDIKNRYRKTYCQSIWDLAKGAIGAAQPTPTGIDALDSIVGGGLVPGVYVIAGDPGAGKTALATQALMYAAHECGDDDVAVYVMLDQGGPAEIAKRLVSLSCAIQADSEGTTTDEGMLSNASSWDEPTLAKGVKTYDWLTKNRAVLMGFANGSFSEMKRELSNLMSLGQVNIRLLVIDYYQLISDYGDEESNGGTVATDAGFASAVIRSLRTWATDNAVPVLLVGQFSKEAITRHSKGGAPEMTDLLGSVDVPYQAESVLCLTNVHDGSGVVELMDVKHRHAGNDAQEGRKARLHLDGEHGYFTELD